MPILYAIILCNFSITQKGWIAKSASRSLWIVLGSRLLRPKQMNAYVRNSHGDTSRLLFKLAIAMASPNDAFLMRNCLRKQGTVDTA